jgi:LmbE family N-acetylglucosaminyl deacetylase
MNVFIAPHNDDEALFGSYIIQTYKPLVIVVTDSYIQYERGEKACSAEARIAESKAACAILGADVEFLHIPDKCDDEQLKRELTIQLVPRTLGIDNLETVFAPAVETGGNFQHNLIGSHIAKLYPRQVRHYFTYTRERDFPMGPVKVDATEEMKAKKLAALKCYTSQWANVCRMYFEQPQKDEYLAA